MSVIPRHNPNAIPIADGFHAHLGHGGVYLYRRSIFQPLVYVHYRELPALAEAIAAAIAYHERKDQRPRTIVPPDPDDANVFSSPAEAS